MAPNNEDFLRKTLMEGLANADFQVFGGLTVTQLLKQGSRLENCRQESCYQEIARSLGVEYLVTGNIEVDRKNYNIKLELISGRDGKKIDSYEEPCQLCGIREVGTKLEELVQAVRRGAETAAAAAPARYAVDSRPSGAEVFIDGRSAGVTPLSIDLTAGAHKLTVQAAGFETSERSLNVESGTSGVMSFDLSPGGGVIGGRGPSRMWAWSAIALGAASVATGLFLWKEVHGQYLGCAQPRGERDPMRCEKADIRAAELEAGVAMGAGGMLMVAGGAMLYFLPSPGPSTAAAPSSSLAKGFVAGVRGRF